VRAPLSEDEIGTIADGYNTTIQSLRDLVRQVQGAATRVSETSSRNTAAVAKLSDQAQQQVERLERALQQLQMMVDSTQVVAADAQKVGQAVHQANNTVQAGDSLMEKTVDGILEIRETVSETAKKIKRLGEASQKISKVVSLIENFATQTNLLALNAAIEATRAGEYGKGFAVVADEVRSLAYQSASATTEIERLVQEIQTGTNEVTEAMEVGIAQVVQGSKLINETRQSLSAIVAATNEIGELVQGITQAVSAQTQQSQTLTEAMMDVSAIAHKTSESAMQISQSFEELLLTSQQLQSCVSQFKVD
jgi:methyl-accepting chemotaxis protein PixJ